MGLYNGEQMILARFCYAMARDGLLPPVLARLHERHGTPVVALVLQAALFSVLVLVFDRRRHPQLRGPFRIPGGWAVLVPVVLIPTAIAVAVLVTSDTQHLLVAGGFAAIGPIIYLLVRARGARPRLT